MRVEFTVPGTPRGKGRPRFSRQGNKVLTYTPDTTSSYENLVRWCWKEQCGERFEKGVPIQVEIRGFFPIPQSASQKKKLALRGAPHTSKCDCDNLAKSVLDALQRLAFWDDASVCDLRVSKRYDDNPRVEVVIESCGNPRP